MSNYWNMEYGINVNDLVILYSIYLIVFHLLFPSILLYSTFLFHLSYVMSNWNMEYGINVNDLVILYSTYFFHLSYCIPLSFSIYLIVFHFPFPSILLYSTFLFHLSYVMSNWNMEYGINVNDLVILYSTYFFHLSYCIPLSFSIYLIVFHFPFPSIICDE